MLALQIYLTLRVASVHLDSQTLISQGYLSYQDMKKNASQMNTYLALTTALAAFSEESVHGRKKRRKAFSNAFF